MRPWLRALRCLAIGFALAGAVLAQSRSSDALRREYDEKLRTLKIDCGQRHLELGVECRKKGLTTQAAEQIVLAVEVSEGLNPGANTVLDMMRTWEDRFWLKRAPKPTAGRLDSYAKSAAKIEEQNLAERLDLLLWAAKRGFEDEAYADLVSILRQRDEPLDFQKSGQLALGSKKLPLELSQRVERDSILINGHRYVRDEFLTRVPEITQLYEDTDARLRVRSTESIERAMALHALGTALLPALEADLGARPTRRLALVVVPDRASYETYLDAAGLAAHKVVTGIADAASLTAVICAEGLTEEALNGVVLHELTHLYCFSVSRSVMPSWYSEGLADTYGGAGTYSWNGAELATGGMLEATRLEALRKGELAFPVAEMLDRDGLQLWSEGSQRGLAFYAQTWAWIRFLRNGAGPDVADKLARWEAMCRGGAIGAANALFRQVLGDDFARLDDFVSWLKEQ